MSLFEMKDVDREFYESTIRDFLPGHIIDIHSHVWKRELKKTPPPKTGVRTVTWPGRVAAENPIDHLLETYRLMFPDKKVTPLIFSTARRGDDFDSINAYIRQCGLEHGLPTFMFAVPEWTAKELGDKIAGGGFLGVKVYLSMSPAHIAKNDITVFDFLPPHQLEVLNEYGLMAMLHLPRDGRLKDPENLRQMMLIEERYPRVKLIVAHVGRAYCEADLGDAFNILSGTGNMLFDISANTNAAVFARAIEAVGPERLLFGSDLPITRMRMRRIVENDRYINLVPRGLYGDVSNDPNMREVDGDEADKLSFFLYEEIAAFAAAAEQAGLTRRDIDNVFYDNAARLLGDLKFKIR